VLVVAPLSGHHATLVRDTVRALLAEHDVLVSDWIDARMVPLTAGPFHLDDYVDYVREWITLLSPDLHVISVCQPTVPVLAAVALMAANGGPQPRSMTMMGGPIDARRSPTAVNNLAQKEAVLLVRAEPDRARAAEISRLHASRLPGIPAAYGIRGDESGPPPHRALGLLPSPRAGRRRFGRDAPALLRRVQRGARPAGRVLPGHDQDRVPGLRLPKGRMFVRGELVRPQAIRDTALLTVEGELDDISGNGQTEAAHALCLNIPRERRSHFMAPGVGHYGIFSAGAGAR
jgi:poly(3-hydroxybutyrate) depolymerase